MKQQTQDPQKQQTAIIDPIISENPQIFRQERQHATTNRLIYLFNQDQDPRTEQTRKKIIRQIRKALNNFIFYETAFNQTFIKQILQETADPRPKRDPFLLYIQDRIYSFMYYDLKIKDFDLINKIIDQINKTETRDQARRHRHKTILLLKGVKKTK